MTADDLKKRALDYHSAQGGKIEIISKMPLKGQDDLSLAYTPGVAEPCKEIHRDPDTVFQYTARGNTVAVVTDGTAVLGLGDIGPAAGLPVMEGKCILFKVFAGVDAVPICLDTKDPDEIVKAVKLMEPTFGAVNLEDISAPRCFDIENRLKKETSIPIFHDDQHGTAIVALGALVNALKVVEKKAGDVKVVINGAGASGMSTARIFLQYGVKNVILCDSRGAVYEGRPEGMNPFKEDIARITNLDGIKGDLTEAVRGADVLIGLSAAGAISVDMVKSMADRSIVMAMANPVPEIYPDDARAGGAEIVCTGRSDFANQINNVLAFPGVLRGAMDVRARDITDDMKVAAGMAIASLVSEADLKPDYIIPLPHDNRVAPAVAAAVARAAIETGVAQISVDPEDVAKNTRALVERMHKIQTMATP